MKLDWTPTGGSLVTLGDDSVKKTIVVESIGGAAQVQTAAFFRGANPALYARGNVAGQFIFVVTQTFATQDLAGAFIKTEYARLNQQGSLVWTRSSTIFTMAGAVLKAVAPAEINGVKIRMRYTFDITTLT
jgi:hypothetical protein